MTMTIAPESQLLSVPELAEYLGISVHTVYSWRRVPGTGPRAHRVGAQLRYRRSSVESWLDSCAELEDARG